MPQRLHRGYAGFDENLGSIILPNKSYFDNLNPRFYQYHVVTNSNGMRGKEVDFSNDRFNIGLFGDSFTFGWGVEESESFSYLIADSLDKGYNQVLNFGVGGYSSGHVYKSIKKNIDLFSLKKIIYFMNSNDLKDNINEDINYQVTSFDRNSDNKIILKDKLVYSKMKRFLYRNVPFYLWLNKNSHLFVLIKDRMKLPTKKNIESEINFEQNFSRTLLNKKENLMVDVSLQHVNRIFRFCESKNIDLSIIWIAHPYEIFVENILMYDVFKNALEDLSNDLDFNFHDSTDKFKTYAKRHSINEIYFPDGPKVKGLDYPAGHFTILGNYYFYKSINNYDL